MTILPIPGGLLNKEIIDLAYTVLGLSDSMFGRTNEEYATGMIMLRAMMGEYPFDQLGFDEGDGQIGSESGIDKKWLTAVGYSLAVRLGAAVGKTLKPGAQATLNRAFSNLCAEVAVISTAQFAPGTPTGAGHRTGNGRSNYFALGE
jgi:hypothetical protein